jgi:hypothetical protein
VQVQVSSKCPSTLEDKYKDIFDTSISYICHVVVYSTICPRILLSKLSVVRVSSKLGAIKSE